MIYVLERTFRCRVWGCVLRCWQLINTDCSLVAGGTVVTDSGPVDGEGESFEDTDRDFIIEKVLVICSLVIGAIALWTVSIQVLAGFPIPGLSIAAGLVGLWGLFLLTVGRWVGDFLRWFESI